MIKSLYKAALLACRTALEKRGSDITLLDLNGLSAIADYFVLMTSRSKAHAKGLAEAIKEALDKFPLKARGREGYPDGTWILLDYYGLVVHILDKEERDYYNLERVWSGARIERFQEGILKSSGIK